MSIGNDERLRSREVQDKLPRGYTVLHALTTFKDEEFQVALADKVITSEATREDLLKWRDAYRASKPGQTEQSASDGDLSNSASDGVPKHSASENASEKGSRENTAKPSAVAENEPADNSGDDTQPVPTVSPPLVSQGDENAPSGIDDGPLSDDEQRALDKLIGDWNATPKRAQDRFVIQVLGLDLSSARTQTAGQS